MLFQPLDMYEKMYQIIVIQAVAVTFQENAWVIVSFKGKIGLKFMKYM